MKLKIIVSLLMFVPVYQNYTMAPDSWWRNLPSSHAFTTAAAYLLPALVYKQRASGPGTPISSYAYLAPLVTTLAQTMATCGQKGWQHALMTTLQWQLPAWALAYYLSYYQEKYDQQNRKNLQPSFDELYRLYEKKLSAALSEFDKFIVQHDGIIAPLGLGDDLKKYYNDLVDLYTQILNYPEQKKHILMTPAQELYARYIAYKVAKQHKLSLSADKHGLSNAIANNAEDIHAIEYLNAQGLTIGNSRNFVDNLRELLKDNDTFNKISDAIAYFAQKVR